ncbi:MAG: phosphotransferase [Anaerolineales bacterium]|nr:MAG: phosphotransferase [Anaerolineales bacterium]
MDSKITARYNDKILQEAMLRYGITAGQIQAIDTFESFIYKFERNGAGYILRIGHSIRKSEAQIQGEVNWINHLARGGVSVAQAIPSLRGKLVEVMDDDLGGQFLATAFVHAKGQRPWDAGWTPARFENYGHLLGRMHALAVEYQPAPGTRRPEWGMPPVSISSSSTCLRPSPSRIGNTNPCWGISAACQRIKPRTDSFIRTPTKTTSSWMPMAG